MKTCYLVKRHVTFVGSGGLLRLASVRLEFAHRHLQGLHILQLRQLNKPPSLAQLQTLLGVDTMARAGENLFEKIIPFLGHSELTHVPQRPLRSLRVVEATTGELSPQST